MMRTGSGIGAMDWTNATCSSCQAAYVLAIRSIDSNKLYRAIRRKEVKCTECGSALRLVGDGGDASDVAS